NAKTSAKSNFEANLIVLEHLMSSGFRRLPYTHKYNYPRSQILEIRCEYSMSCHQVDYPSICLSIMKYQFRQNLERESSLGLILSSQLTLPKSRQVNSESGSP
ncbi:hypothetical protein NPIL_647671, partial [Nephila pilipes]